MIDERAVCAQLREYLYDVDPDAIDRAHPFAVEVDDPLGVQIIECVSACARHMNELVGDVIEQEDER